MTTDYIKNLDSKRQIQRNLNRPLIKDTIAVPTQGYAIVRFVADNPGVWLLRCFIEGHSDSGMQMLFKVGSTRDFPTKPNNLPLCGYNEPKSKSNFVNIYQYISNFFTSFF